MSGESLTEDEGKMLASLVAGLWSTLKDRNDTPTVDEAVEEMMGVELDCGDGRTVSFDIPEVRENILATFRLIADGVRRISAYMFKHPGKHTIAHLIQTTSVDEALIGTILYKLSKAGYVERTPVGSHYDTHQITAAAWLKETRRKKEEAGDNRATTAEAR